MTISIEIDATVLALAGPGPETCPLAVALIRRGLMGRPAVGLTSVADLNGPWGPIIALPANARELIRKFDSGETMLPTIIELEFPDDFAIPNRAP